VGSGAAQERGLTNIFRDDGWFARRAASSGGGATQASYDVMAAKDGAVYVMEVKYRDPDEYIYVGEDEVVDLQWCARHLGGLATIVARWKRDTDYYAYYPERLYRTDGGAYRVGVDDRDDAAFVCPPE